MKLGNTIASFFSFILHPFWIVFYAIVLLSTYTTFYDYDGIWGLRLLPPIFLLTVVAPAIFALIFKLQYSPSFKKEWTFSYFISIICNSFLIYYLFNSGSIYLWLIGLIAAPTIVMLLGFIINFFWRISPYMLGFGALIGSTFSLCYNVKGLNPFVLYIILFILAGCLGVSRLFLRKETPAQVYTGFILGFTCAFIVFKISMLILFIL